MDLTKAESRKCTILRGYLVNLDAFTPCCRDKSQDVFEEPILAEIRHTALTLVSL